MSEQKSTETSAFDVLDGITSFMTSDSIDGHEVKEWSTTQFTRLYPYLSPMTSTLMEGGATFENLKQFLGENYPKIMDAVMPHLVPIILISCPTVTQEYLDSKPFTFGMQIVVLIFKKNIEHIADFFDLKAGQLPVSPVEEHQTSNSPQVSK